MNNVRAISGAPARSRTRYGVLAFIFIITSINYADRASLSITASVMRKEFGIDAIEMGFIFSAFGFAYVLAQLPSGWLLDRIGARRMYALSLFLWSLFTFLLAGVGTVGGVMSVIPALLILRSLIGVAEAPAFPANAKIIATWFPTSERGTASAIVTSSTYFASAVFTPSMAWLVHLASWRAVYIVFGAGGMLLAAIWLKFARDPEHHPRITQSELEHIRAGGGVSPDAGEKVAPNRGLKSSLFVIRQLLANRMLIGIYLGQYCVNVLLYFFLTWFPVYLVQSRGMSIIQAGATATLPALCGFAGGVVGGSISDAMIRRGISLTVSRKTPIIGGMLLSMSMILCNYVVNDAAVVALMMLSFFGKGVGGLGWAVISDVAPREAMGISSSIFNIFGNVAGIVTPIAIGYIIGMTGSFDGALVFVVGNAAVAIFSYLVIVKDIRRVEIVRK
ncbi:MFS transporter [Paraburkholderia tropica]|uniref:MFS transporter n=1 Tax=Paraburkholderia tropica TaxID=92647 RepID=UPI0007EDA923|nr:MFS transporter [Paraburkholderia tropica]OBR46313.1 glucarate transporter [Paraburkholderia tropica]